MLVRWSKVVSEYIVEMLNITKVFPGIVANSDISLQLKKGEVHALLGENGAGKSTLMSVLFGLYQAENGTIKKNGEVVEIRNPNDANALKIGMVHQHFKLVENFTVLENIILGAEPNSVGFLKKAEAKKRISELSKKYSLMIEPDNLVENITVGMQQRVEILKMLYRDNDILIFDEPTAVLTPQEITELMQIMRDFAKEGKSILFITHKLNEIMEVADRCTVLRKGKCIGTVDIADTTKEKLSQMMVGREVNFSIKKSAVSVREEVLRVENLFVASPFNKNYAVKDVSFDVRQGEIVCIAGIDGNGQSELVYALTGIQRIAKASGFKHHRRAGKNADELLAQNGSNGSRVLGKITLRGVDITNASIRKRSRCGISHIPEDRQKFGLVLDFTVEQNLVLQRYWESRFQKAGFINQRAVRHYAEKLIEQYDIRSGQGADAMARSISGGNQQKTILAREIDKNPELLVAVQPTRGLDIGAIEYIHKQIVAQRDAGKAVLLVSLELDEVMDISDRILVMYEGEIVAELDPKKTTLEELGLYMAGAKRQKKFAASKGA